MKVALTWDYEMYFGASTGTVENCMLLPTEKLLEISNKFSIKYTFFTDVGYLTRSDELGVDGLNVEKVESQIKHWDSLGHETALHIHPHWEDSSFDNNQWIMNVARYKLSDFSKEHAYLIIKKYSRYLNNLISNDALSFRAGGWCIQPFEYFKNAFIEEGIKIDSSVFFKGKNNTGPYQYDFSECPIQDSWPFKEEAHVRNNQGEFIELPIFSMKYHPLFFWKLFILGRLNPSFHKPFGNGIPAKGGGSKFELLSKGKTLCVSMDGFFASKLEQALKLASKKKFERIVFIGHPKACTKYSLKKLEEFISANHLNLEFTCLKEMI